MKGALTESPPALPSLFGLHDSRKIVHITYRPLDKGSQHCKAAIHCLIVHGAEPVVAPPMHSLRLVWKRIYNAQVATKSFSDFLRLQD